MASFLPPFALIHLIGNMPRGSSPTRAMSICPLTHPSERPSSSNAMTMKWLVILAIWKPTNWWPPNSGSLALLPSCANMLRDAPFVSRINSTHIPLFLPSPPFARLPPALSSRSPVILSPTFPSPTASTLFWSWSTMGLLRGWFSAPLRKPSPQKGSSISSFTKSSFASAFITK